LESDDVVEERTRFVLEYDSAEYTMAELCRVCGIARKTGYEWVSRYEVEGLRGLEIVAQERAVIPTRPLPRSRGRLWN
jgi:transposase-like protein